MSHAPIGAKKGIKKKTSRPTSLLASISQEAKIETAYT
jgi:hypothetical protein